MRWLYHVLTRSAYESFRGSGEGAYAPPSLGAEGFVHASYRDRAAESARLYFPPGEALVVLRVDPRALGVALEVVETPRGPMPHVLGPVPRSAIVEVLGVGDLARAPDAVEDA